jgi:glutathione S-transferase
VTVTLYWFELSNPGQAVRLMLEHKGLAYRTRDLLPGLHRLQVRAAGFDAATVPALKLDGRRVQGSLRISRELERLKPDPPLFPAGRRAAVEEAEAWGEAVLQPVTARVFHWALAHDPELREWLGRSSRVPAARALARVTGPVARVFARDAPDAAVRSDLAELPAMLDHVDDLIAAGTIGAEPTAADFQIATTVREVMSLGCLGPLVRGRPAERLALSILPDWAESPVRLPPAWLPDAPAYEPGGGGGDEPRKPREKA